MLEKWLNYTTQLPPNFCFEFIQITENKPADLNIIKEIQNKILTSYQTEGYLKFALKTATTEKITQHIKNMLPESTTRIDKNVRQGDFGEILASLIASKFQNRISFNKLRWKFNNSKSVLGTDIIAYDSDKSSSKLYYYEVKTREKFTKKENKKKHEKPQYITVIAHSALVNDMESKKENVLNFFSQLYYEKQDFESAKRFSDHSLHPDKINKSFEVFIITDTKTFDEKVLSELHNLPPSLSPLTVTIVLIDNFLEFVKTVWTDIENTGVDLVRGLIND